MLRSALLAAAFVLASAVGVAAKPSLLERSVTISRLPDLPPLPGETVSLGLAGTFAGAHNGALIVAGGANFPGGWPKDKSGGPPEKVYHRDVYVLEKSAEGKPTWRVFPEMLPHGYSYGVCVATDKGVLCYGGEWKEPLVKDPETGKLGQKRHLSAAGFLLVWDKDAKTVSIQDTWGDRELPAMPKPCAYFGAALIKNTLYIAGGDCGEGPTNQFLSLDLGADDSLAWQELPPCPGPPRWKDAVAAQSNGESDCVYVFSGSGPDGARLTDSWRFSPKACAAAKEQYMGPPDGFVAWLRERDTSGIVPRRQTWRSLAEVGAGGPGIRCVAAAPAAKAGDSHILVFGGDDGDYYQRPEWQRLQAEIKAAQDDPAKLGPLLDEQDRQMVAHPGFRPDILAYHTITDTWVALPQLPRQPDPVPAGDGDTVGNQVTTNVVPWDGALVMPSGEVRPGVRSPAVWRVELKIPTSFGAVNYAVLVLYFLVLLAMGFYFAKREKTTDDFFRAGKRIPWWAAGLSVFGTMLSAITFMAAPAKIYATNWLYVANVFLLFAIIPIVTRVFIPFYRRLDVTTAYEYLEKRFNVFARLFGSLAFLLMQFGRLGIVLLLPSIALSVVTGINVYVCIAVMGVLATVYTVMGGMEAVIWTDVLQVFVLMGGACIALVLLVVNTDGGISGLLSSASSYGKLECVDWSFDFRTATIWVLVLGAPNLLIPYASDQAVLQRYLTTKTEKEAKNGLWLCVWLGLAALVFWAVGTALWGYYRSHPANLTPALDQTDRIFPWYIVNQLPTGVAGLVIAGVFAASMSSLDSSMNSMSAAVVTDFYRRFSPRATEESSLRLAKWVTALAGLAGTVFALIMAGSEIKSLWDTFSKILGLFGGGLAGLFMLGMFTRRATGTGAVIGLFGSAVVLWLVKTQTNLHFFLYGVVGIASCVVIGWLASLATPAVDRDELTVYKLPPLREE
jgi:SSS family transporter